MPHIAKCSLIRKGMSIQTYQRRGPNSIVVNPCKPGLTADGINLNTLDSDLLNSFIKSMKYTPNGIATTTHMVDDNMFYYTKLADLANQHILYHLHKQGICSYIKANSMTTFASINKQIIGSPHDHHSYLLENDAKSIGVKIFVPADNSRVKTVIEDTGK
jgi:hypothetical protein